MVKSLPANAGDARDVGLIPGLGRSPGGGNGNQLQYSCLKNSMERGAWWAIVCWHDWATECRHTQIIWIFLISVTFQSVLVLWELLTFFVKIWDRIKFYWIYLYAIKPVEVNNSNGYFKLLLVLNWHILFWKKMESACAS